MKKIIGLLSFATLLLAGCSIYELGNSQKNTVYFPKFYASFDDTADETTKTYVDDKMKLRWTKNDRLSIFVGNTYNHEYRYDGETGANNGSFSAVSDPGFVAGERLGAYYAVYPYNVSHEMDPDYGLSVVLPFVQKFARNSFGLGANTMIAATENIEDNLLQFKNLCGYVVVKLYGEGTVTSLKLEGNNGEKISGMASVHAAYGTLPSVTMSEEATTSITLDCGDGVNLGTTAETATEFWFCVPPVTFSKGFTVTATKADGWQMVKSTSSSREVVRNTKNALTPIETLFDIEPQDSQSFINAKNSLGIYSINESSVDSFLVPSPYNFLQTGLIRNENNKTNTFRIQKWIGDAFCVQITYPTGKTVGETISLNIKVRGTVDSLQSGYYSATIVKIEYGKLWLKGDKFCFIVKE